MSDATVCEVCGGPNAAGYNRCPGCPRRGKWKDAPCAWCGKWIGWIDCPTGGWWAHHEHPADGHDAQPVVYVRERPCPLCENGERENDTVCPSCAARLAADCDESLERGSA